MWKLLFTDILFSAALIVFIIGAIVFFWCLAQIKSPVERREEKPVLRHTPLDNNPTVVSGSGSQLLMRDGLSATPKTEAQVAPATHGANTLPSAMEGDMSVIYSVFEEKFSELNKRLNQVESIRRSVSDGSAAPAGNLSPLVDRISSLENSISQIKTALSTKTPAESGVNDKEIKILMEKMSGLQKLIESLSLDDSSDKNA
ncbi:MAG: hypothetical protein LHV69_10115 [Elusimicrobia bacterium]|nr:hypothetical protein [Candidatus Obscuribacterium magneticum]